MRLLEEYTHNENRFSPQVITENWQVALLNFSVAQLAENIKKVDRHLQTDEVFVLLAGQAILIVAEETVSGMRFVCEPMCPDKIYNVPCNVWHNIVVSYHGKVLIVENRDTHLGDFEFYNLSASEYEDLQKCLRGLIEDHR